MNISDDERYIPRGRAIERTDCETAMEHFLLDEVERLRAENRQGNIADIRHHLEVVTELQANLAKAVNMVTDDEIKRLRERDPLLYLGFIKPLRDLIAQQQAENTALKEKVHNAHQTEYTLTTRLEVENDQLRAVNAKLEVALDEAQCAECGEKIWLSSTDGALHIASIKVEKAKLAKAIAQLRAIKDVNDCPICHASTMAGETLKEIGE